MFTYSSYYHLNFRERHSAWRSCLLPALLFVVAFANLAACTDEQKHGFTTLSGSTMGTHYRVQLFTSDLDAAQAIHSDIETALSRINQTMSTYIDDSEISLFNRSEANTGVKVSLPTAELIALALQISEETNGAFDITIGSLVELWGFGSSGRIDTLPSEQQRAQIQAVSGADMLNLSGRLLSKRHDKTQIDLSAIAKGYAVDELAKLLEKKGITRYLVDIGGELRVSGMNAENQPWRLAIERPAMLGGVQQVLSLTNTAIATSGDYRNFISIDDQQFSHTIDPRTGRPVVHNLASVTVLAEQAAYADAMATALLVMGAEKGYEYARKNKMAAYFVIRSPILGRDELGGDELSRHESSEFESGRADKNLPEYSVRFTDEISPYLVNEP